MHDLYAYSHAHARALALTHINTHTYTEHVLYAMHALNVEYNYLVFNASSAHSIYIFYLK